MTDQELELISRRLGDRCHAVLGRFTVLLAIMHKSDLSPAGIKANGTGSLIDTGLGRFLVTCDHVYREFETRKAAFSDTVLVMVGADGKPCRDISKLHGVRGRDKDLDLAVLDIPTTLVYEVGKLFSVWNSWPPSRPEKGRPALVYGYPRQGTRPTPDRLELFPMSKGAQIASLNNRQFILADTENDSIRTTPPGFAPITSIGGMSGSAVYVFTREQSFSLAGFMCESNGSMDIIYATHADHIRADGTI